VLTTDVVLVALMVLLTVLNIDDNIISLSISIQILILVTFLLGIYRFPKIGYFIIK
jgi:hypothetical protein